MLLLLTPLLLSPFDNLRGKELVGTDRSTFTMKDFKWKRLFSGEFQENFESSSKNNVGLGNSWVRAYNELQFRLFRYTKTKKLILGKEDCFYEEFYIRGYLGHNFIGDALIEEKIKELRDLQKLLYDSCQIYLLPVFEPGKAFFAPQYIPDYFHPEIKSISNYERYIFYCNKYNINYLDLQACFKNWQKDSPHLLYSKYGVHWSSYGMWRAVDTLIPFIEKSCNINLPDLIYIGDSNSTQNKDLDFDLEPPMNLLYSLPHEVMNFPIYQFDTNAKYTRPKVLTIADSYYWSIMNHHISANLFQSNDFWYYNKSVWPNIFSPDAYVNDSTRKEIIASQDIILLMITDANLYNFGWCFLEQTLPMFNPNYKISHKVLKANELLDNSYSYDNLVKESIRKEKSFKDLLNEYIEK